MAHILIIDDEQPVRKSLREIFEYEGHKVSEAATGMDGVLAASKKGVDVVFCDVKMPQMDGLDVLDMFAKKGISMPVVMISGHGTVETAVASLHKGAYDFIQKPLDLNRILVTLRNALEREVLVATHEVLQKKVNQTQQVSIIGSSRGIQEILGMIDTVAPTEARVLVMGPNGAGKELVARQIHNLSPRAQGPFVEVNCAAIPSELIESELFGHEKGAFTSAVAMRKGKFEQAEGGTLFLDEVGDMSASAQAKVLRALQEHKISRVGSDADIAVNVRVVAATNKDLKAAIAEGTFREDLFHRLAVVPMHVPSLAERKEDIPLLVEHFLKVLCASSGRTEPKVTKGALDKLGTGDWTGNIRELRNAVERLLIFCPKEGAIDEALVIKYGII
ncbi:MAG: sigma-54 dependent transcriptional regulator [Bacteroidetes bacterium]|nr:sigma-54 dependent transcriptional regulator [Bacteroidota bacterium]MDA0903933.1 sigma-54 dependent transcriptional regulator [Bacteroidota bacterium]MDA1242779.1 sigma-54 dependent transcriptional regulator [Bacteroidota bacterium]